MRIIADLSILGLPVVMTFEARKFFCDNPECRRKTFAEEPLFSGKDKGSRSKRTKGTTFLWNFHIMQKKVNLHIKINTQY
jgi:hypothetical protein